MLPSLVLLLVPLQILASALTLALVPARALAPTLAPALAQTLVLALAPATTLALILALALAPAHSVVSNPFPRNTRPTVQNLAPLITILPAAVAAITSVSPAMATGAIQIHFLTRVVTPPVKALKLVVRLPSTRPIPMVVALVAGWILVLRGLLPHQGPISGVGLHLRAALVRTALERWSSLPIALDA